MSYGLVFLAVFWMWYSPWFFASGRGRLQAFAFGLLAVGGYYALGCLVPYGYLRRQQSEILTKMGWIRYGTIAFLFWSMMGLPIKLFLNLFFHIKYIWVTPWFNI